MTHRLALTVPDPRQVGGIAGDTPTVVPGFGRIAMFADPPCDRIGVTERPVRGGSR
jgi:hypothetical protein